MSIGNTGDISTFLTCRAITFPTLSTLVGWIKLYPKPDQHRNHEGSYQQGKNQKRQKVIYAMHYDAGPDAFLFEIHQD